MTKKTAEKKANRARATVAHVLKVRKAASDNERETAVKVECAQSSI